MGGASFKSGTSSLSDLGDYGFWSRDLIGATAEDFAAAERGALPPDRKEALLCAQMNARERLMEMDVPGIQAWMNDRRRVN